jgi:hypothetical protein
VERAVPATSDGIRNLLVTEVYMMSPDRVYRQVFRHLVRAPWYAVREHGNNAKVLLIHTERSGVVLATRGRIFEDLASRQGILGNRTVIEAAQRLYFDEKNNWPRFGASGHGPLNGAVDTKNLMIFCDAFAKLAAAYSPGTSRYLPSGNASATRGPLPASVSTFSPRKSRTMLPKNSM